jgi:hypothetical protein
MQTKMIEATNEQAGGMNWGKFMVCRFTPEEWAYRSAITDRPLLTAVGWASTHVFVVDLQTGEGGIFLPHGLAPADLDNHRIWVCPMFEPFLIWLYEQDLTDLETLPALVQIADPKSALSDYRRKGPKSPDSAASETT